MAEEKWTEVPVESEEWTEVPVGEAELEMPEDPMLSAKGLARGAINAIPAVGAVGGGLLGTGLGPAGTIGGAGLGYAAGGELRDVLKNRLLGDEAVSTDPVDSAKRVVGNVAEGATAEMGGQLLGKGMQAGGRALQTMVDDVATAPLGQEGSRGMAAGLMDKVHRAGKAGNAFVDDIAQKLTPQTGNATADGLLKGVQRAGRYAGAGKVQGALDTAEHAPKAVQWAAGKVSPAIEGVGNFAGPYAKDLSQRLPHVFNSVSGKMAPAKVAEERQFKPYDKNEIMQKVGGTQYAQVLDSAAQRGDEAFNATYFVLQSDPRFRQAIGVSDATEQEQ